MQKTLDGVTTSTKSFEEFLNELYSKRQDDSLENLNFESLRKKQYQDESKYYVKKIVLNGDNNKDEKFLHYENCKNELINSQNNYECIKASKDSIFYPMLNNNYKIRAIEVITLSDEDKKYLKSIYNFTKFINRLEKKIEDYPDTNLYTKVKEIKDLEFVEDILLLGLKLEEKNGFYNPEGIYNLFYFARDKITEKSNYRDLVKLEINDFSRLNNPTIDLGLASYYSLFLHSSFLFNYFQKDSKILDFDGSSFGVLSHIENKEKLNSIESSISSFLEKMKRAIFNRISDHHEIYVSKHQLKEFEKFLLYINNVTNYHIRTSLDKIQNKNSEFLKFLERKFGKDAILEYIIQSHNTIQTICLNNAPLHNFTEGFYFDSLEMFVEDLHALRKHVEEYPELIFQKGYVGIVPKTLEYLKEYYLNFIKPLILKSSNINLSYALSSLEEKIYAKLQEENIDV